MEGRFLFPCPAVLLSGCFAIRLFKYHRKSICGNEKTETPGGSVLPEFSVFFLFDSILNFNLCSLLTAGDSRDVHDKKRHFFIRQDPSVFIIQVTLDFQRHAQLFRIARLDLFK